jgi:hypothetical protein
VCSAGKGVCERSGTYECAAGKVVCSAKPGKPSTELCGTKYDEDCDGKTDEAPDGACCHHEDCGDVELCMRPADDAFAAGKCTSFARPNADCKRDGDKVFCTCREGYDEDDAMCVRNACIALKGDDPPCASNQTCEPTKPGEKTCSCKKGFDDCDEKPNNGCEQPLDVIDNCGECGAICDARATCTGEEPSCICDRPLIGDGSSCIGFGPISAGVEVTCGIRLSGAIECFPASAPTPPSGTFKQLALGGTHHCAVAADGTVACWGTSSSGAQNVPTNPPNSDYVQVVVGNEHSCALKKDGTPVCWGVSQTNPGSATDHGQSAPPRDTFRQLAAGGYHSCGLHADGSVRCWGAGTTQDADCRDSYECGQAMPPDEHFIQIAAGIYHSCGLRADGSVLCWGAGATDDDQESSPNHGQLLVPSDTKFTFISAGAYHTCGVRTDKQVSCWGAGSQPGTQLPADFGQSIAPTAEFLRVAAGGFHTCGLTNVNQLQCWGGELSQNLPQMQTAGTWPVNP